MQAILRRDDMRQAFSWAYHRIGVIGAIGVAFFLGMAVNNHEATQDAVTPLMAAVVKKSAQLHQLETHDIPKLKSQIGCEHRKADVALDAATGDPKSLRALPDCPPIAAVSELGHPKP